MSKEPDEAILTPAQAEAVVADRIEDFGLDALPRVRVRPLADGSWRVSWTTHVASCRPMRRSEWKFWLERHVGPLDPERLKTTEG